MLDVGALGWTWARPAAKAPVGRPLGPLAAVELAMGGEVIVTPTCFALNLV